MPRPKGSKNKPKVAKASATLDEVAEQPAAKIKAAVAKVVTEAKTKKETSKKTSKVVKVATATAPTPPPVAEPKPDFTALKVLVKAVYDTMPQDQQLRWQQPSEDATLLTPEDKITAVLVTYFGLDKVKSTKLDK